jgi:Fic family protein
LKKNDFVTGLHEVGSPPGQVEADLMELLDEVGAAEGKDALKVATYFHARFEHIHPFADGNGRVGRTLLNYYLMTHGEPPLVLYDEDKKRYYDALQSYDTEQLIDLLEALLRESTVKTWSRTLERSE